MQSREKIILLILAGIKFTYVLDFTIMIPLGPTLIRLFNLDPIHFSCLVASYTIAAGLCGFFGSVIIDRFDRKKALLFCYLGFIAGNISCAMANNFDMLMISRILSGAFGGVLTSVILSMVSDIVPYERRAAAIGKILLAFSFTSFLGVPVGMYLANNLIWQAPFLMLIALSTIFFIVGWRVLPSMTAHIDTSPSMKVELARVKGILKDENHLRALLVVVLLITGQFTVISFLSTFSVTNLGFEMTDVKYIYMLAGISYLLTLPVFGRLADTYGKLRIFTIFIFLSLIPIFILTNLPPVPMVVVLVLTTFFFTTVGGRMVPVTTMISAAAAPQHRGSFLSLHSAVQQLSSGFAVFLSGSILLESTTGRLNNFHYIGWLAIISSVLCLYVARKLKARS
ncbi:MAG: MFS transporter [Bacteroidota bacterium]|nr:MFS transporter [Bacteroidota bacterium]